MSERLGHTESQSHTASQCRAIRHELEQLQAALRREPEEMHGNFYLAQAITK